MNDPQEFELSRLRGEEHGDGAAVVLLHGLTATRRYVLHGSCLLARRGYRLVAYDARGHGDSEAAPTPTGYEYRDLVGDLREVLDELRLERPVLAGSSMGAATALALALEEPQRVAALVLITPGYDGAPRSDPADLEEWDRLAEALEREDIEGCVALSGFDDIPERFRETARTAMRQRLERHRDLRAVADAVRVVPRSEAFEGLDRLDRLDLPALVVGSRDETDPGHPLAVAKEYARRLPRARLMVEDEGESPLAWRGTGLSRAIDELLNDPP